MTDTDDTDQGADAALAARMALGDTRALAEAFDRFAPTLTRYAWALADDRGHAGALVQDTLLALWRDAAQLDLRTTGLLPWLLVTCRDLGGPVPADTSGDQLRWVRDQIDALPERERTLIDLCIVQGNAWPQATAMLGLSTATRTQRGASSRERRTKAGDAR